MPACPHRHVALGPSVTVSLSASVYQSLQQSSEPARTNRKTPLRQSSNHTLALCEQQWKLLNQTICLSLPLSLSLCLLVASPRAEPRTSVLGLGSCSGPGQPKAQPAWPRAWRRLQGVLEIGMPASRPSPSRPRQPAARPCLRPSLQQSSVPVRTNRRERRGQER